MVRWSESAVGASPEVGELAAAVDLGSNSFHMLVAKMLAGEVQILDRQRERVQLAGGLDDSGQLTEEAQSRAIECLARFGEQLREIPLGNVRAVGTNTFRKARNIRSFLVRAESALGHPISVISGAEEARLIYLGIVHSTRPRASRRLVIDIGGGSTECMLGLGAELIESASLEMGCVSFTQKFFGKGVLSKKSFEKAIIEARLKLRSLEKAFRPPAWETCAGSSGTINAVQKILQHNGWSSTTIDRSGLKQLRKALIAAKTIDEIVLPGLKPERQSVIAGGVAVLQAVFDSLKIDQMVVASGALREGLLYDLHGRFHYEDVRDRTVRSLARRFNLDEAHAIRVETTAVHFFDQVATDWKLEPRMRSFLSWAARLHEIGLTISHVGYHKHGLYFVQHCDLDGFGNDERDILAMLVRSHRKRVQVELFEDLPRLDPRQALRLVVLLRLAVLFHRSRGSGVDEGESNTSDDPSTEAILQGRKNGLRLTFPPDLLEQRPLTRTDLQREAELLAAAHFELSLETAGP